MKCYCLLSRGRCICKAYSAFSTFIYWKPIQLTDNFCKYCFLWIKLFRLSIGLASYHLCFPSFKVSCQVFSPTWRRCLRQRRRWWATWVWWPGMRKLITGIFMPGWHIWHFHNVWWPGPSSSSRTRIDLTGLAFMPTSRYIFSLLTLERSKSWHPGAHKKGVGMSYFGQWILVLQSVKIT